MNERSRWMLVIVFATAMAWMEAATVVYLRTLVGRIVPHQLDPLPLSVGLGEDELVRELATLIMLLTVGWIAGHSSRSRFGYFLVAFGVWDVFYYVFLKIICGWPNSLLDWDILFLLPLPWWGPVIAPVTIAALMIVTGTLFTQFNQTAQSNLPGRWAWIANLIGALLALFVFMADAIRVMGNGSEAVRTMLPTAFNWPLFLIATMLLAAPAADIFLRFVRSRQVMILNNH